MSKFSIIFVVLVLFSFVKSEIVLADRLLLGVDWIGYAYKSNTTSIEREWNQQQYKDEYGESEVMESFHLKSAPSVSLEINFGKPSTGWGLMFVLKNNSQKTTNLIDFPNDNETAEISHDIRVIGIPIMYTWGDPELGKNGGWGIRLGFGPSILYYDPLIIKTKDETITKRGNTGQLFGFFSWDWGRFSLNWQQTFLGQRIVIDEIKSRYGGGSTNFTTYYSSSFFSYAWYF